MKNKYRSFLFAICSIPLLVQAQQQQPIKIPSKFHIGLQAGTPIFWGDLFSLGEKTRLGYGAGIFGGYRISRWLDAELGLDYGVGKLGAKEWQTEDLLDQGLIRYTHGSDKLGDIYSKTSFLRVGLRLPVKVFSLFSEQDRRFHIELAPHLYLNSFNPAIYSVQTDKKIMEGISPKDWSYSAGGDIAFRYKTGKKMAVFLRSSLSWLTDDRYEGVITEPAWMVNLQVFNTLGLRLDLDRKTKN